MFWYIVYMIGGVVFTLSLTLLLYAQQRLARARRELGQARDRLNAIEREIETERREASLKIRDEIYRRRREFDDEIKREKIDLDRLQKKLIMRDEDLQKRELRLDELKLELQKRERELLRASDQFRLNEAKLKTLYNDLIVKLEQVSGMSNEEAKATLLETLHDEVYLSQERWIQKVEEECKQRAKDRAREVLISTMQRYTSDTVNTATVGVVHLPNEDMKGRIIGKEGRNIKALEMATGMEFIIGDTPEVITISGFNPVRREVARRVLEILISDGRINPTRIEETVAQCEQEIEEIIEEYGKEAILEFNLQGVSPEIVTLLGKLHFRTSYSQNVLQHSKEVAYFARAIAAELNLDQQIAARAGLFHDIGKAMTAELEGPHAQIGADVVKRCGEDARLVNAIAAHHEEVAFSSIYGPIILIADTISASRPGARRETFAAYIKRLEELEEIASCFEGVKKAYALQAGREIRIIVEETVVDDERARIMAREIAKRIEGEMNYPGQIKVNVIREKRAIEYAR
ncbi:TPA: ribonuclease Y [Candidatus Dependentiae bacterium]|nr:MAG: Ribonuclease Y [candidate division TM6 bacterium GW2011_GWF2_36_131]KKQ03190.1 MAG: Ribonuclease Y [candidate division TM6 bacterium GW2011_GWE2_36_25]HBR70380.1 ribonuclease Y [Candidatus Dependentiae bacterium]HCU00925.1 ribonuclease Y [Candidatus Dependentiae bacterium]